MSIDAYIRDIERSGLTVEEAEDCGIYYEPDAKDVNPCFKGGPCAVIRYTDPHTGCLMKYETPHKTMEDFCRVRYLFKAPRKYDQPIGSAVMPYFPPGLDWPDIMKNPEREIVITEGEKKALALVKAGFAAIGLGGVFNFQEQGAFLSLLEDVAWYRRPVVIMFDSDRATNPNIRLAEDRLASELSLKRKAAVSLVTLPVGPNGEKTGADDYIVRAGAHALHALVDKHAKPLRKLDAAVLDMNRRVAYIKVEDLIYDEKADEMIRKGAFLSGSDFGNETVKQVARQGNDIKEIQVARAWLTHPLHRVYDDTIFDPATPEKTIYRGNKVLLNRYRQLPHRPGPTKPFWDLTDYVTKHLSPEHKEILWKLLAYKVQNPGAGGLGIALVLVGGMGSGKSMWCTVVREMFGEYGTVMQSEQLIGGFHGWLETSLCVHIDEAAADDIKAAKRLLNTIITEDTVRVNEKYRVARQVANNTFVMITANEREAASFTHDDRRMFIIETPPPMDFDDPNRQIYADVAGWMEAGGPQFLLHELMELDIGDWKPPAVAPITPEKYVAMLEGMSPLERLFKQMEEGGMSAVQWSVENAWQWAVEAEAAGDPMMQTRARQIAANIMHFPIRPYYSPRELMLLAPMMVDESGRRRDLPSDEGKLSRMLRDIGVPLLRPKDTVKGFKANGVYQQFLVVTDKEKWATPLSQAEFDAMHGGWPTFGELRKDKARGAALRK